MIGILTSTGEFWIHEPPYELLRKDNEAIETYLEDVLNFDVSNLNWQVLPLDFEVKYA